MKFALLYRTTSTSILGVTVSFPIGNDEQQYDEPVDE